MRFGNERGGSRHRLSARMAFALAATLAAAAALVSVHGVDATSGTVSQSRGRIIDGSILGVDLATLVSLDPAQAINSGQATVSDLHPLSATVLSAISLPLGPGLQIPLSDVINLGVLNQVAVASPDGSSLGASGVVSDSGAVAVSGQNGVPQSDAALDLSKLLPTGVLSTLANLKATIGDIAATASQAGGVGGTQPGTYKVQNLNLDLTSPLLASTISTLVSTVSALQPLVDGLTGALDTLLGGLVTVTGLPDLATLMSTLTTVTTSDGTITVDLTAGTVAVDLAAFLATTGLDLNNLPPNTQLVPYLVTALTNDLLPAIVDALNNLVQTITTSLQSISVSLLGIPVPLGSILSVLNPVITAVTQPIVDLVANLGSTVITPLTDVLTTVLGLTVNAQSAGAGTFTETALKVAVVPASPVAAVSLASAAVGPNNGPLAPIAPPVITSPANGSSTTDTTPTIVGTGLAGLVVTVTEGASPVCSATVDANGGWTCVPGSPLQLGAHTIAATQTDGTRTSGPSNLVTFTIVAPALPTSSAPTSSAPTSGAPVVLPTTSVPVTPSAVATPASTPLSVSSAVPVPQVATAAPLTPESRPQHRLATTGAEVFGLLALAAMLVLVGTGFQFVGRPARGGPRR